MSNPDVVRGTPATTCTQVHDDLALDEGAADGADDEARTPEGTGLVAVCGVTRRG